MIARLHVLLPFSVVIPEGEVFNIHEYSYDGYVVKVFPMGRSDVPTTGPDFDELLIDNVAAFQANALRIDFVKEDFDRSEKTECDPPYSVINTVRLQNLSDKIS